MSRIDFEPWEPEESVGKLWHAFASRLDAEPVHDGARVLLSQVGGRLAVLFRGLGGDAAVEIKPVAEETSHHRLSLSAPAWHLGRDRAARQLSTAPPCACPNPGGLSGGRGERRAVSLACRRGRGTARSCPRRDLADPLQADLAAIATAQAMTEAALAQCPRLRGLMPTSAPRRWRFRRTPPSAGRGRRRGARPRRPGRRHRAAAAARQGPARLSPVPPRAPLARLRPRSRSEATAVEERATEGPPEESAEEKTARRARRRKADQADRTDSFILHKFEAILSMTEFLNLNRRVEDDDEDTAKKAADDQDEIGLAQVSKAPATRLKLHLDLAPEDVDREALSGHRNLSRMGRPHPQLSARPCPRAVFARRSQHCAPVSGRSARRCPYPRRPPPVRGFASQPRLDPWPPGRRRA
jgi:nitric oxide reductase NorD protein